MSDDILIFDRALKRRQRERAATTLTQYDFLYQEAAARLLESLESVNRSFPLALEMGARNGLLGKPSSIQKLIRTDMAKQYQPDVMCEEEFLPFAPKSFDLILSLLNFHWVNDLPGALVQMRRALKPDALLLGSLFGSLTLKELRESQMEAESRLTGKVTPRISPFTDAREMAGLLQRAGFALPVADTETITVMYKDALTLMRDLRGMGESNALLKRQKGLTSPRTLYAIAEEYQKRFGTSEGIPATFEIVTITGFAPA